jgi:hypothetical protein
MDEILSRLQAICGPEHASDALVDRMCYRRDCGPTPGGLPAYIARPESVEEVSALVKLANETGTPLFVWGRATTFVDSGVPEGSIVVALDLLNKFTIDLQNQVVTAQAGAIWHAIDAELKKLGWELAAPGGGGMFSASVGGTIAYNAVPHGITEYGVTGDHLTSLEVVLPSGEILYTGSAANAEAGHLPIERGANGPDLAGLFIVTPLGHIAQQVIHLGAAGDEDLVELGILDRIGTAAGPQARLGPIARGGGVARATRGPAAQGALELGVVGQADRLRRPAALARQPLAIGVGLGPRDVGHRFGRRAGRRLSPRPVRRRALQRRLEKFLVLGAGDLGNRHFKSRRITRLFGREGDHPRGGIGLGHERHRGRGGGHRGGGTGRGAGRLVRRLGRGLAGHRRRATAAGRPPARGPPH